MSPKKSEPWISLFYDVCSRTNATKGLLYFKLAHISHCFPEGEIDENTQRDENEPKDQRKTIENFMHGIAKESSLNDDTKIIPDIQKDTFFRNFKHRESSGTQLIAWKGAFLCIPMKSQSLPIGSIFLYFEEPANSLHEIPQNISYSVTEIADCYYTNYQSNVKTYIEKEDKESLLQQYMTGGLRFGEDKILSIDPLMEQNVFSLIKRYKNLSPIYIYGETGTGKELVAKALHYYSSRKSGPYVCFNSGTFRGNEDMQYSNLFGREKGAATNVGPMEGLFRIADNGTLFLDEIGSSSQDIQVALLRVLEEAKIRPVGSDKDITVDVRVIVANNVPLESLVRAGTFREDLMFRLKKFVINIPPLRERSHADIDMLTEYFLKRFSLELRQEKTLSPSCYEKLHQYSWPGNVRELQGVIQSAAAKSIMNAIMPEDLLLPEIKPAPLPTLFPEPFKNLKDLKKEFYRQALEYAKKHQLSQKTISELIGIDASTLTRTIEENKLEWYKKYNTD